jgi:hypothetical protein
VEAGWLSEGEFGSLGNEGGDWGIGLAIRYEDGVTVHTIVIEVEENSEKQCEWDSEEDITNVDIPESHQP